ncbi:MAG: 5'-nucleotidase C-terminal domain-containing protein [Clostridia bacterium]|nr:5'-nucleotidase C-terminal domain-containing protein [Clostridia bacterium]
MKKIIKGVLCALLCLILILPSQVIAADNEKETEISVIFTHDIHSHLMPSKNADGTEYGGLARIKTVIDEQKQKHPDALLLDGGDFSMGSLFQTGFSGKAYELRAMGALGYDATTFGNHEFDYYLTGLASMLTSAKNSGEYVPAIVESNYVLPENTDKSIKDAFDSYGVRDYILIERGGNYFAVFGVFGEDARDCTPASEMEYLDPHEAARSTIEKATAECLEKYGAEPFVICLSHSGTTKRKGEDYELAKKVDGIDIIVSAHSHSTLATPVKVNDTYIVSCGEYGEAVGSITLGYETNGNVKLKSYSVIPIGGYIKENGEIETLVEAYKSEIEEEYLSGFNMTFDTVLCINEGTLFDTSDEASATQHESTLGNLFSDAYKWMAEKELSEKVDIALTASGVIRDSIPIGPVTVYDVFNTSPVGIGTEGELVRIYLTGEDLLEVFEMDASVQPLMTGAQLFISGAEYSFNTARVAFNKVDYAKLRQDDGTLADIEDNNLYSVVTGMYCVQMLRSATNASGGVISIVPRDHNGNVIEDGDYSKYIVNERGTGAPLKEWYAIAMYISHVGGDVDSKYALPDGRKIVYESYNPAKLLSGANSYTYIFFGSIALGVLLVSAAVASVIIVIKRKKRK